MAPYEADGQLAYFASQNYVDVVVTDDSDLIGYASCDNLLYKVKQVEQQQQHPNSDNIHDDSNHRHYIPHE
eukprot:14974491-Ditylum_brightwellii.AAC.1